MSCRRRLATRARRLAYAGGTILGAPLSLWQSSQQGLFKRVYEFCSTTTTTSTATMRKGPSRENGQRARSLPTCYSSGSARLARTSSKRAQVVAGVAAGNDEGKWIVAMSCGQTARRMDKGLDRFLLLHLLWPNRRAR